MGTEQQMRLIHPLEHIQRIRDALPTDGFHYLDADTVFSPGSEKAAYLAVGALRAMRSIKSWLIRRIMLFAWYALLDITPNLIKRWGFCLFNTVTIAAEYARQRHHLEHIAIVDFDVHHGNGTQATFYHQPNILYSSSHEMPNYPGTGDPSETGVGNIVNVALTSGDTGVEFREKYQRVI